MTTTYTVCVPDMDAATSFSVSRATTLATKLDSELTLATDSQVMAISLAVAELVDPGGIRIHAVREALP